MKRQRIIVSVVASFVILFACKPSTADREFTDLKNSLFQRISDISELPIYADPPTFDFENFKKGEFLFQIDSLEIEKIRKYRNELEPFIVQYIDSGYSWIYLAAYLQYESALPKLKEGLLNCERVYGWEGYDYSKIGSYLNDEQHCFQMAYISAIEYIMSDRIENVITLTQQEYNDLKEKADKCTDSNIDRLELETFCSARWLLGKLRPEISQAQ